MDSPFFSNRRGYQQPGLFGRRFNPSPSSRGVPIYHVNPTPEAHRPADRASSAPKVVQVPVRFVKSEKVDRSGSAVKIQKVFRGFLVRKCLRKIKDIKEQVDEIEERLKRSEVVDLVRRDAKERLRVSESLMALLLKLDSISGVDFGVRGCRKAVIRKAIALQERIDAIVASDSDGKVNGETIDVESEARIPPVDSKDSCTSGRNSECPSCCVEGGEGAVEGDGKENDEILNLEAEVNTPLNSNNARANSGNWEGLEGGGKENDEMIDMETDDRIPPVNSKDSCANSGSPEGMEYCVEGGDEAVVGHGKEETGASRIPPVNSKDSCAGSGNLGGLECCAEGGERAAEVGSGDDEIGIIDVGVDCEEKVSEAAEIPDYAAGGPQIVKDGKGASTNRELLEKMMEENEKMMGMMSQLVERNELQSAMMEALTRRVELLEKAFVCDRLRRKKAAKAAAATFKEK